MKPRTRHSFRLASAGLALGTALIACSSPVPTDDTGTSRSDLVTTQQDLHAFGSVHASKNVCPPAKPGESQCHSHVFTDEFGNIQTFTNVGNEAGLGADSLASAYGILSTLSSSATIALVDAYDDPTAGSDIEAYRTNYGMLPLCADGCFRRVNQSGVAGSYPGLASANAGNWLVEETTDIEMATAACPTCNIILVEANSTSNSDLYAAVDTAASLGASVISLSWGGSDDSYVSHLNHPGVAIFASSGDSGFGVQYPAGSSLVTAVGGTLLTQATPTAAAPRGWTETAWSGAGSGCTSQPKPSWQKDTLCSGRTVADVSAVASTNSPVAVYTAGSWYTIAGTSVASPLVAGIYAATGNATATGDFSYAHLGDFYDVVGGSNGSCGSYLCTAVPGYDGPTGNGTPNAAAMAAYPSITSVAPSSGTNAGGTVVTIEGTNFSTAAGATQVTFGGAAATSVSCLSSTTCVATSPMYAELDTSDAVAVQVTVGSKTDIAGPQDLFIYGAGPACTAAVSCAGVAFGYPELVLSCPETVSFYSFEGTADQTLLATGTTTTVAMDNPGYSVAACVGSGCTSFSTYEASATYCGAVPPYHPPPTCDGHAPTGTCSVGWHCCGTWKCGLCE